MGGATDRLQVVVPVADIRNRPAGGARERQLLLGEPVTVSETDGPNAAVRADRDGYTGWMRRADLGPLETATHRVAVVATHLYSAPDLKSPERSLLSFGSLLSLDGQENGFFRAGPGVWVPSQHVLPVAHRFADPVAVAALFLGTPYLWGGNSRSGIDCSGLVQVACIACGLDCPGDSGEQEAALGTPLDRDQPLRRGDLVFWKGHVAWASDPGTILHANARAMAVSYESLEWAVSRIEQQGEGAVTSRRRLALNPSGVR